MDLVRGAVVRASHALPARWKRRLKWTLSIPDMGASLENMARLGFRPRVALDIGAYVGAWTLMCRDIFPGCQVCMFEPQPDKQQTLTGIARAHAGVHLVSKVLTDGPDPTVTFYPAETGSSLLPSRNLEGLAGVTLPATTLAEAVRGTSFESPDLIKIDVQGAELKVFGGGPAVLERAQVVIMEVSLVPEYRGGPMFAEVIEFMDRRGLRVYDICTIWRNNRSRSMNEADVIFARAECPLFAPEHFRLR